MAYEEENEVSTSNLSLFTFNELQDAFDDLMFEFKNIKNKNNLLKKMMSAPSKENEDLQKENEVLRNKVCVLKKGSKKTLSQRTLQKKNRF